MVKLKIRKSTCSSAGESVPYPYMNMENVHIMFMTYIHRT